ncbi:MAG: type IV pilus modification PilV family protein [Solirubrobacterales bacterium]
MQGSLSLRGAMRRRLKDERGWALIDALASAVVVVLAFVGTTMAFNGSTASVARDAKKTQALIVAQNSINEMRSLGQRDISTLLALNNTSKTITYRAVTYTVDYDAYYVTGLGSDQQDACEVAYSSGGGTARYIYMRVKVSYAGQTSGSSGGGAYISAPASLDSYYSPEGGGVQADTGTLRIYVLNRGGGVAGITSPVKLYIAGETAEVDSQTPNATTGCVLFTGLVRNTYQVKVSVTSKQDIYMTNSSSLGTVTLPVVMPDRGALSREIRIDLPVTVSPRFYTNTGTNANYEVRTANGNTNPFFGKWIGATDQIKSAPSTDYSYIPTGIVFMPHLSTPSAGSLPNAMFPNAAGYAAYAGACDINNPNIGVTDGSNNQVQVPTSLTDTNWLPGGTYTPSLWLSQIRPSVNTSGVRAAPVTTVANSTYFHSQILNGTIVVKVRLSGDLSSSAATPRCKPSTDLYNTWQTLGSLSAINTLLADDAEALPAGKYDVCVSFPWRTTRTTTNSLNQRTNTNLSGTRWFYNPGVLLRYRSAVNQGFIADWDDDSEIPDAGPLNQGTDCAA